MDLTPSLDIVDSKLDLDLDLNYNLLDGVLYKYCNYIFD